MKKLVLVLLVAVLSVPAFAADPNITIGVVGTTVTVGYTADSADLISGMGLTVQLSSGTIGSFTDLQGDNGKYNIHPCSIVIDGSAVTDYNTPIYSGGNGGTSVVVEYGALYVGDANAPAAAGNLFSFNIVGGTSPVTVTVSANHAGGIVTEALVQSNIVRTKNVVTAPAPAPTITSLMPVAGTAGTTVAIADLKGTNFVNGATVKLTKSGSSDVAGTNVVVVSATKITCNFVLPAGATVGAWNVVVTNPNALAATKANAYTLFAYECFPSTFTVGGARAAWVTLGRPACWCTAYQCDGDADGIDSGGLDKFRVFTGDLNLVTENWKRKISNPALNPCADIDHKDSGGLDKFRVFTTDLNKVTGNWKKKNAALPGTCPRNE